MDIKANRQTATNGRTDSLTVDVHGAADLMKVHPKTVLDLIGDGAIPAAKVGRSYVMLTKDVLSLIENAIAKQTAARMRRPMSSPKPRGQIASA